MKILLTKIFNLLGGRGWQVLSKEEKKLMKKKGFRRALRGFYREIEKGNELSREMEKKHGFKVDDIIKGWKEEEEEEEDETGMDKRDAISYYNQGNDYYNQGDYDIAIQFYENAIVLKPDYADAYINLGVAYDEQENYDKAIEAYKKVIEIDPDYALAYYNLGLAYDEQDNYDKAIQSYEKAIEVDPDYAKAYNNLGLAYKKQDNYDKAIQSYEKAIEVDPDCAEAYINLRVAYKKQDESRATSSAAKKSDPTAEIRKYAKLKDDGIITEEEFQAKKKELLGL
ncbi:MAG: tetratricopeptide repeat protein [Candidatus Marinimicrobia bacterium]|jgi:tetratricopeptide (TPR) repeat protein|nr:tetratricopeptide repeat protein [Candidatus Neomarinimicrobiota bacterium]|tara:strand:+ start:692 stop:1540 length:849 start_codon:yes stop_codon:yes gene_type:complete